jgi:hypothetical protein
VEKKNQFEELTKVMGDSCKDRDGLQNISFFDYETIIKMNHEAKDINLTDFLHFFSKTQAGCASKDTYEFNQDAAAFQIFCTDICLITTNIYSDKLGDSEVIELFKKHLKLV